MSDLPSAYKATITWARQRQVQLEAKSETGSTNDDAKKNAHEEIFALVLYLTEHQTQGRGRGSHSWLDTGAGENFLSTWSLALHSSPQAITGPRIGLALYQAAKSTWPGLNWSLKAPNDLFLNGKKVAGLLVETVSEGQRFRLLVGLGLNVTNHPRTFKDATHLTEAGLTVDESEWFRFLDALKAEISGALHDVTQAHLTSAVCQELTGALNANPQRSFEVKSVSPNGDLVHAAGVVRWMEI